jgi:lysophospholipase L1-like esterase
MFKFTVLFPLLLIFMFPVLMCTMASAQGQANPLINPGFDKDLTGWKVQGDAHVSTATPLADSGSLQLGPGAASVSQRYAIGGLRIVGFGAMMKAASPDANASVHVRCYDTGDHLLMDARQDMDPKKHSLTGDWVGTYFKTQGHTAYIIVSIEKDATMLGSVMVNDAVLSDYDQGRTIHAPLCDLHQYLHPIWQGKTVYNETVLLESDGGQKASGQLLFTPKRILSVQDYGLTTTYTQGKDYTLNGRTITCTPNSQMPSVKDTDFPAGDTKWYALDGKHIVVTYTHEDAWHGPVPRYAGSEMPRTIQRLRHHRSLTIVAYGDSITLGDNVSGYMETRPYMPTWAELFVKGIQQSYSDDQLTLYNTALGGATSTWGLEYADSAVATLNPDLVLIAFGMNDFWSLSPDQFRQNIQGIINRVRTRRPQAEFLLISSMRFDPAYTSNPDATGRMAGYVNSLRSLTGQGVQMLDMNAISGALFAAKKPKDLIANPLHPNDFLARWYAQGLIALMTTSLKTAAYSEITHSEGIKSSVAKKGVGNYPSVPQAVAGMEALHTGWYYDWGTKPVGATPGIQFVPMIWGPGNVTSQELAAAKASGTGVLLGFNEPNVHGQSNMTVGQAIADWPLLEATKMRLGSPAVGTGEDVKPDGWLAQFMTQAKAHNFRVDFICLHPYQSNFDPVQATKNLQTELEYIHHTYGLPIWVTEYGMVNWDTNTYPDATTAAQFATLSAAMMDRLPYIERYAWYSLIPNQDTLSLTNSDGSLNAIGDAYAAAAGGKQ